MRSSPSLTRETCAGGGHAVIELDALAQASKRARRGVALDAHEVLLGDARTRVREEVSQTSVVGQDQEAFGVHVEASDGKDPHRRLHQVEHGRATLGVRGGRDDAVGLVKRK